MKRKIMLIRLYENLRVFKYRKKEIKMRKSINYKSIDCFYESL